MGIDPDILVLDFLLRKPLDDRDLKSLVRSLPIPSNDTSLQKLFLLRKLESEVSRHPITDRAVLLLEHLARVESARGAETLSDTMRRAYCAVAVESTLALLKNGVNDRYEFHEAENKIWRGMGVRVEKLGLGSDELLVWKEDIERAVWDDCVCERILKNGEGIDAARAVDAYIRLERDKLGPSFLELLAKFDPSFLELLAKLGPSFFELLALKLKDDKDLSGAVRVTSAHEVAGEEIGNANQVYRVETRENDITAQCDMAIDNSVPRNNNNNNNNEHADQVAIEDVDYVDRGSGQRKECIDQIVEQVEGKERNFHHPEGEVIKNADEGAERELDRIGGEESGISNKETGKVIGSINQTAEEDCCNDDNVGRQELECVYQVAQGEVGNINQARESEADALPVAEEVAASLCIRQDADGGGNDVNNESPKGRIQLRSKLVGLRRTRGQVVGCQRGAKITNSDEMEGGPSPRKNNLPHSPEVKQVQEALEFAKWDLHAMVKDPLPEALQFAETVCLKAAKNKCQDPAEGSRVEVDVLICDADGVVQPPACRAGNVSRPSLMKRNNTAHTSAWDDSIDGSDKNPAMHDLPNPRPITATPLNLFQEKKRRRVPRKWSLLEEDALRAGVEEYGKGNWKAIMHAYRDQFEERTEVDLKDKWRNLTRG